MPLTESQYRPFLTELASLAARADAETVWPVRSWELVREMGALQWAIPKKYGGSEAETSPFLSGNEHLAGACLTTCFILSQRDAAVRRLLAAGNETLRQELLPPLAAGDCFATVGLSQLTTSRQHGQPVLVAREDGDGFRLDGSIPWVTGADHAQHVIIGATLENDIRQVLLVLPTDTPGVAIGAPLLLMALQGSLTAEILLDNVRLDRRWLLAGPQEKIMSGPQGGAGGLQTSCLALGLAGTVVAFLKTEAEARPGLLAGIERLEETLVRLRNEMYHLEQKHPAPDDYTNLRAQANTLVVQASQAALIASKGAGFVRDHPAQRWLRQAMFFLVWSCPWPAASATLDYLTMTVERECL
jgi:butyryl-CoA dehydrogenase